MICNAKALVDEIHIQRCVSTLGVGGKIYPRRVFFGNGKILLVNTIVTIFYCKGIISTKLIAKNTCRWVGGPVTADGIEILWLTTNDIAKRNPTICQPAGGGGGCNGDAGWHIQHINFYRQYLAAAIGIP